MSTLQALARREPLPRRQALAAAAGALLLPGLLSSCSRDSGQPGGQVLLDVADASGRLLDLSQMRALQSNGAGEQGLDDQLLDSRTLEVVAHAPLQVDEGPAGATAALLLPAGRACTLSLSWPTSHGYSTLLADLPGPGRYSLTELAALSLHHRQEERLNELEQAAAQEAANVQALRQTTGAALEACAVAAGPTARARLGNAALEAAAQAQLELDGACTVLTPADAYLGVTLTRPPTPAEMTALSALSQSRRLAARLVVEDHEDAQEVSRWREVISELQQAGASALVQVCDSQTVAGLDDRAWRRRLQVLVQELGAADAWETGNELGGDWAGPQAVQRALETARLLSTQSHTSQATRVLTLYYQLGQDTAERSVISWARTQVGAELRALTDVVGLSVYPQWHPLGVSASRVLDALATAFPGKRLAVTELGYGAQDLSAGPWWFGSPTDLVRARSTVAAHLTSVALGRADAWGAPFWWYYLEDELPGAPGGPVSSVLRSVAEASR